MDQLQAAQAAAMALKKPIQYICAGTANGVMKYLAPADHDEFGVAFIDVSHLPELTSVSFTTTALEVGSSVPLGSLIEVLEEHSSSDPAFQAYAEHLKRVASVQIRAVGSWAGNVMLCRASTQNSKLAYFPSDVVLVHCTMRFVAGADHVVFWQGGTDDKW